MAALRRGPANSGNAARGRPHVRHARPQRARTVDREWMHHAYDCACGRLGPTAIGQRGALRLRGSSDAELVARTDASAVLNLNAQEWIPGGSVPVDRNIVVAADDNFEARPSGSGVERTYTRVGHCANSDSASSP